MGTRKYFVSVIYNKQIFAQKYTDDKKPGLFWNKS